MSQNCHWKKGVTAPLCVLSPYSRTVQCRCTSFNYWLSSRKRGHAHMWPRGMVSNLEKTVDVPILLPLLLFKISSMEVNLNIIKITSCRYARKNIWTNIYRGETIIILTQNTSVSPKCPSRPFVPSHTHALFLGPTALVFTFLERHVNEIIQYVFRSGFFNEASCLWGSPVCATYSSCSFLFLQVPVAPQGDTTSLTS